MEKSKSANSTYHHGDLRNALIEAGISLLEEKNAREVTLRQVAKRAGVSHAAPYRHFEDKVAILSAMAEQGFRQLAAEMNQAVEENQTSYMDQMIGIGQKYVAFAQQHPAQLTLMFSDLLSQGEDEAMGKAAGETYQILEKAVLGAQEEGSLKANDREKVTNATWSMVHGLAMLAKEGLLVHEGQKSDEVVAETLELLMQGVGGQN